MSVVLPPPAREPSFIFRLIAFFLILAVLLFVPAGRVSWLYGWLFLIMNFVLMWASVIYLGRVNPEIFKARKRIQKGTKLWDKVLLSFMLPSFAAIIVVAALDNGRFGWSRLPWWVVVGGYVLCAAAFVLLSWAQGVNRFFEPGVRIQSDRGHHVIDTGPYTFIRHPGYLASCYLFAGSALALGSLYAMIPAAITSALLILRTALEDRTLQRELPGYQDYTQRVPYRLLPGLW